MGRNSQANIKEPSHIKTLGNLFLHNLNRQHLSPSSENSPGKAKSLLRFKNPTFTYKKKTSSHSQHEQKTFRHAMYIPLGLFLVAMTGIIVVALPVSEMGFDPHAAVEGKLEVREPQVSL